MTTAIDWHVELSIPPSKRERKGEWDWFTELPFGKQQLARRHMAPNALNPEDLVPDFGPDIDSACRKWLELIELETVTGARRTAQFAQIEHPEQELFRMGDLLGPADIGEMLNVKPDTIRKWMARNLLPQPVYVNASGRVKLWAAADIDAWARSTGRLIETCVDGRDF